MTTPTDFRHYAACRTEDPELFFPIGTSGPALMQIAEAKTICRRCPVAEACLEWAMRELPYGVAGGTTEDERHALRRSRDAARRAAERETVDSGISASATV